jgi:hypothetical protein
VFLLLNDTRARAWVRRIPAATTECLSLRHVTFSTDCYPGAARGTAALAYAYSLYRRGGGRWQGDDPAKSGDEDDVVSRGEDSWCAVSTQDLLSTECI